MPQRESLQIKRRSRDADASDPYDIVPHLRRRQDGPIPDDYTDPRFIALDMEYLCKLVRLFETDIDIQTFASASMNHALAGGILFTRKNKKLDEESSDWHCHAWSQWVKQLIKIMFCAGFCIAGYVRNRQYGAEPTVLNLDHIEIRYFLDKDNIPHFRVWEKLLAHEWTYIGGDVFTRRRLEDVKVWWTSPPTKNGVITSQLTTLMNDLLYEQHLLQVAFIADRARAQPPLVSQYVQQPYKSATAVTVPAAAQPTGPTPRLGDGTKPYPAAQIVELMNGYGGDDLDSMSQRMGRMLDARINNGTIEQIYLRDGRELVKQIMPEPPHAILLGFRQSRMVRVALAFGLTLPALTHTPTGMGQQADIKKGGQKGRDDDGSRSVYFENYQRELKQRIVIYIHAMYRFIHAPAFAVESIRDKLHSGEQVTADGVREDIDVQVSLPGQPDEDVLVKMWMFGILRYDSFINYLSSKHSIPLDAFETKPKLSLKDINGIAQEQASDEETTTTTTKDVKGKGADGVSKNARETTTTTTKKSAG